MLDRKTESIEFWFKREPSNLAKVLDYFYGGFMTQVLSKQHQDDRITYHGMTWQQFKLIDSAFENPKGVRISFYKGALEIVSTSVDHEFIKTMIGALLEFYCFEIELEIFPSGSCTQQIEGEVSLQADESYSFDRLKPIPDLSIEVVMTSGGVDKLKRYQALGTPEVWFWEDGMLRLYRLRDREYHQIARSEWLPDLDLELFRQSTLMSSLLVAKRALRQGQLSN